MGDSIKNWVDHEYYLAECKRRGDRPFSVNWVDHARKLRIGTSAWKDRADHQEYVQRCAARGEHAYPASNFDALGRTSWRLHEEEMDREPSGEQRGFAAIDAERRRRAKLDGRTPEERDTAIRNAEDQPIADGGVVARLHQARGTEFFLQNRPAEQDQPPCLECHHVHETGPEPCNYPVEYAHVCGSRGFEAGDDCFGCSLGRGYCQCRINTTVPARGVYVSEGDELILEFPSGARMSTEGPVQITIKESSRVVERG